MNLTPQEVATIIAGLRMMHFVSGAPSRSLRTIDVIKAGCTSGYCPTTSDIDSLLARLQQPAPERMGAREWLEANTTNESRPFGKRAMLLPDVEQLLLRYAAHCAAAQPIHESSEAEDQPAWMDDNILICGEHSITFTKERDECFVCTNRAAAQPSEQAGEL